MGGGVTADTSTVDAAALAARIDHTLLDPFADEAAVLRACRDAAAWGCASVCVHPRWVATAATSLGSVATRVCTVVGFPHGANTVSTKVFETRDAIDAGADEVDMVITLSAIIRADVAAMEREISAVVDAADRRVVKVILETGDLDRVKIVAGCEATNRAGAHFVKTSTGFLGAGAQRDHVRLMREVAAPHVGVKASGGIRDRAAALAMIDAGAQRLGLSKTALVLGHEPT